MSTMKGKAGNWELEFQKAPRGKAGTVQVRSGSDPVVEVSWIKDATGIWIEFPHGVFGFDIAQGEEQLFRVSERGGSQRWDGVRFARKGEEAVAAEGGQQKKGTRIRAQMPGKIVRVMVQEGALVAKDQPLVLMEAMKMENEIRAPHSGVVESVKVTQGQAVESGADLVTLKVQQ